LHIGRREADHEIGHNPAGGWAVLVLLALLLVQVGTGLFSNDDVMTEGPLARFAGKGLSDRLTSVHSLNFTLLQIAVALHVLAVATYAVLKRQNLVRPMVTGRKRLPVDAPAPRIVGPWLATTALVVAVGLVVLLVNVAGRAGASLF
jgi:cytochrome b